ncbi:MAG: DUF4286 family protein [Bacteroidia bacterium]|nr:DUF4286 family protein [Bacteroidia bacterium]
MILYNVTTNVEATAHEEWLDWMLTAHIPDVMSTGMFLEFHILKVISDDESGGHTYSVQYLCASMEKYQQYEDIYAPALRADFIGRYKDKSVSFRTLLEVIK